ncbi:MAG TPA: hypothetical protein VHD83_22800 [Puia sp.]|nr:hypothetical protein [Puia sp.]
MRKKQLAVNDKTLWDADYEPTVRLFEHELGLLRGMDVHCQKKFSLKDLTSIGDYSVTTIMAHHEEDQGLIELYDGRYDFPTFLDAIPSGYDKIFDLTLCRSTGLQMAIRRKFPDAVTVANKLDTNPEFRLICYRKAISLLQGELSYVDAIARVRLLLINSDKFK